MVPIHICNSLFFQRIDLKHVKIRCFCFMYSKVLSSKLILVLSVEWVVILFWLGLATAEAVGDVWIQ